MAEYYVTFREFINKAGLTRAQIGKELGVSPFLIFL